MPCPYLRGRTEQQLFTDLSGLGAQSRYEILSQGGFRRSHHIAYRPACRGCAACVPVRVVASEFRAGRNWRRILNRNADLAVEDRRTRVSDEQYALFARYMKSRHDGGDLIAACLTDRVGDGYSAVYSFFDPSEERRSLGSYVVLSLIERARAEGLPYVYLGFWVADSPKMRYKIRFQPIEGFGPDGWRRLADDAGESGN